MINPVNYKNTLPDVPFDLKFINFEFNTERFSYYKPTSLEQNVEYNIYTELDLDIKVDLIDRDKYLPMSNAEMHPTDKLLLADESSFCFENRSKNHSKNMSWLRRSEYISSEQTRFQPQSLENIESQVGARIKKNILHETLHMDRKTQIAAIEKTFNDSKSEIKNHYSKPSVTAVEVLPIFPDFKNCKYAFAEVLFDAEQGQKFAEDQHEVISQTIIRGLKDENNEQFAAYFLPTEETLKKRSEDVINKIPYKDNDEYEYVMMRKYDWKLKSKASGYDESYFFDIRSDSVYFNELDTRVRLNKRYQKSTSTSTANQTNIRLVVRNIPLSEQDHKLQEYRQRSLYGIDEENSSESDSEKDEDALKTGENNSSTENEINSED